MELSKIQSRQPDAQHYSNQVLSDQILRIREVAAVIKLSPSSVNRLVANGKFPRPIKLSSQARGWLLSEINQWMEDLRENS